MQYLSPIVLSGGPLDGAIHQLYIGFQVPNELGVPGENWIIHWYTVDKANRRAAYRRSEPMFAEFLSDLTAEEKT